MMRTTKSRSCGGKREERKMSRKRSGGGESALAIIVVALMAMPVLALCLLKSENEEDRDWGIFFAVFSVLAWAPMVWQQLFP